MIVREIGDELWLFDQRAHAALAGRMAEAWGSAPFSSVPLSVRDAAARHDDGWALWDPRPRLDPGSGRPHPYSHMPAEDYRRLWRHGLEDAWAEGEQFGLMVSLLAMRFFGKKSAPEDRALFDRERGRETEALEHLGVDADPEALPQPYAAWHEWFFFWDGLSLFLCEGWDSPWDSHLPGANGGEIRVRVERVGEEQPGGVVRVDPFPFRAALELEAAARVISNRRYATQQELDGALEGARVCVARWRVRA